MASERRKGSPVPDSLSKTKGSGPIGKLHAIALEDKK
jgi:hypothetical protein